MVINSIESLDQLNDLCCDQFLNSDLISFDLVSAYVINNNLCSSLRANLANQSYSDYSQEILRLYPDLISNIDTLSTFETYAPVIDGVDYYFYPYSSKDFLAKFFADLIPTLRDSLFNLMKSTGRITQIGGGSGKAVVIKTQKMAQAHFDSLPKQITPHEAIVNINDSLSSIQSYISNAEYLMDIIQEKDNLIDSLNAQIAELNNKVLSVYQTTWR